jgi:hypothetical protein
LFLLLSPLEFQIEIRKKKKRKKKSLSFFLVVSKRPGQRVVSEMNRPRLTEAAHSQFSSAFCLLGVLVCSSFSETELTLLLTLTLY